MEQMPRLSMRSRRELDDGVALPGSGSDGTSDASVEVTIAVSARLTPPSQSLRGEIDTPLTPSDRLTAVGFAGLVAYSVEPRLPDGLHLSATTGIISGTPTSPLPESTYTVTGADGTFRAAATVTITVDCPARISAGMAPPPGCPNVESLPVALLGADPNLAAASLLAAVADPIHGPYVDATTTDTCARCHRTHTASGPDVLPNEAASQTALCFTCHNSTGSASDVESQFASAPANDPTTRSYFSHAIVGGSTHTAALVTEDGDTQRANEFEGQSNRHAECADCHNPHASYSTPASTQQATGWTASGRIASTTGVQVTNGAAGSVPTYTLLDGIVQPLTAEYQLCMKCHSSFTTLPDNAGFAPSQYALDAGVEFNPGNPSTHPVEGPGSNQTPAMALSLAGGTAPYKLWSFTTTSTIRCTNCHADDSVNGAGGAGQVSAPHGSPNRGILIRNYRDRTLKAGGAGYAAAEFALCLGCHYEQPFTNESSTATNFSLHAKHLTGIAGGGSSQPSIDTPGAGQGNAICAECHFRLHSTEFAANGQAPGPRLVNFAPNVQVFGTSPPFDLFSIPVTGGRRYTGTCNLTCHGQDHLGDDYQYTVPN